MKPSISRARLCGVVAPLALIVMVASETAAAAETQLVDPSATTAGQASPGAVGGFHSSGDGRFVAFSSSSAELIAGLSSHVPRAYLRDVALGTTTLVSRSSSGAVPIVDDADVGSISDDGRFVVFSSTAALTPNAPVAGATAVYLFDRIANTVDLVSVGADGLGHTGLVEPNSHAPSMTADGRFVVFGSTEALTADAGSSFAYRVYLRDRVAQQTLRISPSTTSTNYGTFRAGGILADGSKVLYRNDGGVNTYKSFAIYVHDVATQTSTAVYTEPSPVPAGFLPTRALDWTSDGLRIVFDMQGAHPALGDADTESDIYLIDLATGSPTIEVVSRPQTGMQSQSGRAAYPSISNDGRYVSFWAQGIEFIPWAPASAPGFPCLRDRVTQRNALASLTNSGAFVSSTFASPALSGDGQHVVFKHFSAESGWLGIAAHLYRRDRIGFTELGYGKPGYGSIVPSLTGSGSLIPGSTGSLLLTGARPLAPGAILMALDRAPLVASGGPLAGSILSTTAPLLVFPFTTDGAGQLVVPFTLPVSALPPEFYVQSAIADPTALGGVSVSSALLMGM